MKKCEEKRNTAFELLSWRRKLGISWTECNTNVWFQKVGVPEENGLVEQLKKDRRWPNMGTERE